jgi:hypothetical protein
LRVRQYPLLPHAMVLRSPRSAIKLDLASALVRLEVESAFETVITHIHNIDEVFMTRDEEPPAKC